MSKAKPKEPSEADLVFNRASITLARNQALIASWLPPRSETELVNAKSQEQLDREEEEMFAPVPELLGVGAVAPKDKDGLPLRSGASALEQLRVQLLGKKGAAALAARTATAPTAPTKGLFRKRGQEVDEAAEEEDEEEESRATAIVKKTMAGKSRSRTARVASDDEEEQPAKGRDAASRPVKAAAPPNDVRKRPSSFMDSLLEKKGKKKKRR